MNIQDAIKSGKLFRPVNWCNDDWFCYFETSGVFMVIANSGKPEEPRMVMTFNNRSLLGDWELKQSPKKVTLYQYLYKDKDGAIFMSAESSETLKEKQQYGMLCEHEILKTFSREIEY